MGVSYSAKRQVRADIKRVTKATKLYSNRQAHTEAIARSTGTRQSKEKFRKSRYAVEKTMGGKTFYTYKNLSKAELMRALRKHRHMGVTLLMHADYGAGGKSGSHGNVVWRYGHSETDADELLEPGVLEHYERRSNVQSTPDRYGAVFR